MTCQQIQTPESCVGNVPQIHMIRAQAQMSISVGVINICKCNSNGQTQLHEAEKISKYFMGKKS